MSSLSSHSFSISLALSLFGFLFHSPFYALCRFRPITLRMHIQSYYMLKQKKNVCNSTSALDFTHTHTIVPFFVRESPMLLVLIIYIYIYGIFFIILYQVIFSSCQFNFSSIKTIRRCGHDNYFQILTVFRNCFVVWLKLVTNFPILTSSFELNTHRLFIFFFSIPSRFLVEFPHFAT